MTAAAGSLRERSTRLTRRRRVAAHCLVWFHPARSFLDARRRAEATGAERWHPGRYTPRKAWGEWLRCHLSRVPLGVPRSPRPACRHRDFDPPDPARSAATARVCVLDAHHVGAAMLDIADFIVAVNAGKALEDVEGVGRCSGRRGRRGRCRRIASSNAFHFRASRRPRSGRGRADRKGVAEPSGRSMCGTPPDR